MEFAIPIPQFIDGGFDAEAFRAYLRRAEELGFAGAWAMEGVLGSAGQLGGVEAMTYAAACTERLRLGCAVFVTPLHSPVHLAKSLASLDQISRGRVEVGVGTGGTNRMFSAFGIGPERLVARFNEGLDVMRACWTQPKISFHGDFWRLDGATMEPKPVQRPYPPIWYGGNHPNAVRRAARRGDGFFGAGSQTTEQFAEQVRILREAPNRDGFRIAKRVYLAVDDDAERARRTVGEGLTRIYGRDMTPVAVHGTPDDVTGGLREVIDAGAEMILLHPILHQAEQMERLAAEIIPQLA